MRGLILDPADHPVRQATVTLKSATSEWVQTTRTDSRGGFVFAAVPIGDYSLTVVRVGFAPTTQPVTVPSSGSPPLARINLAAAGGNLATVTVAADALTAIVNSSTPTTLVNRQDIEDTPGANRTNSLAMITDFVPGAYFVHDQLHVRGGHQTSWSIDGVEIPNTNIASNLGPQIDPKDIDYLEAQRGGYEADAGDRTYGVFNVIPRTGFERNNQAELLVSGGNYGQTNDYFSVGSHTDDFAYYASVNGNRSDLGIETPVAQIIHDKQDGYGGFSTLVYNATPQDQLRLVMSARHDDYQIPNAPGDTVSDVQREADALAILSWVRTFNANLVLTSSMFYHYNRADLDAPADDFPISTTDQRSSSYAGGQETLRVHVEHNDVQVGILGFAQHDNHLVNVVFNDNSGNPPFNQALNPNGSLVAAYVEDTFKVTSRWDVSAGVRQTRFSGGVTESATSPRIGTTYVVPGLNWILRAFWGKYYQAPPLETVSGPLLAYAQASQLAFLPLRGEQDTERQFGLTIPVRGWSIDLNHFVTRATNFFDHNPIGNSNVFLPITIDGALIRAWEVAIRSPRFWDFGQFHLAYSNQTAEGIGGINGGLTDFQPAGYFALDHDQRNTLNLGIDVRLPWQSFAAIDINSGSGLSNGDAPPSHLPGHTEADLKFGKSFAQNLTASISILNATNKHLLVDNSLTFGGLHYNNPRQVYAEVDYKFGY